MSTGVGHLLGLETGHFSASEFVAPMLIGAMLGAVSSFSAKMAAETNEVASSEESFWSETVDNVSDKDHGRTESFISELKSNNLPNTLNSSNSSDAPTYNIKRSSQIQKNSSMEVEKSNLKFKSGGSNLKLKNAPQKTDSKFSNQLGSGASSQKSAGDVNKNISNGVEGITDKHESDFISELDTGFYRSKTSIQDLMLYHDSKI